MSEASPDIMRLLPSPLSNLTFPLTDVGLIDTLRPLLRQCGGVATMCYHAALSEEVFERPEFFVASLEMLKEYLEAAGHILNAWWEPKEGHRSEAPREEGQP